MAQVLCGKLVIGNSAFGEYVIYPYQIEGGDTVYEVFNGKGEPASKSVWQTYDGAAACAELLAEGYFKE